jgi:hypothetical protein
LKVDVRMMKAIGGGGKEKKRRWAGVWAERKRELDIRMISTR